MDRRYEIFVSSTFEDLKTERQKLLQKIVKSRHIPSGMEFFPAGPQDISHIDSSIDQADVFVLIIGWRYGSKTNKNVTYTRHEFDYAKERKKPILVFILDEEERKKFRQDLPTGHKEREHDHDLQNFITHVSSEDESGEKRLVNFFSLEQNDKSLVNLLEHSLPSAIRTLEDKGGWIKSSFLEEYEEKYKDALLIIGDQSRNPFFIKIARVLNEFDKLSKRCTEREPDLKKEIADYFLEEYLVKMVRSNIRNYFLGSGSSIAYFSASFLKRLGKEQWLQKKAHLLNIKTNNILSYLDSILSASIRIELYPFAPPEKKYGATFGDLLDIPRRARPKKPREIAPEARPVMKKITKVFEKYYSGKGIVFMSVSGIEWSDKEGFQGPHVGSYYNKLFKRAILESECPFVLFVDEKKMNKSFDPDTCYPICNFEKNFKSICKSTPLAIALAARSEEKIQSFIEILKEFSMDNLNTKISENGQIYNLIASNQQFQDLFKGE